MPGRRERLSIRSPADRAARAAGSSLTCCTDGEEQQVEISRIASRDAYNWGYDPVHYGVPEGSYATDPDSPARVLEYRQMVQVRAWAHLAALLAGMAARPSDWKSPATHAA